MVYPRWTLDVIQEPGRKGGDWLIDAWWQKQKRHRRVNISRAQGKTLSQALGALQYGIGQQEKQHPELWSGT